MRRYITALCLATIVFSLSGLNTTAAVQEVDLGTFTHHEVVSLFQLNPELYKEYGVFVSPAQPYIRGLYLDTSNLSRNTPHRIQLQVLRAGGHRLVTAHYRVTISSKIISIVDPDGGPITVGDRVDILLSLRDTKGNPYADTQPFVQLLCDYGCSQRTLHHGNMHWNRAGGFFSIEFRTWVVGIGVYDLYLNSGDGTFLVFKIEIVRDNNRFVIHSKDSNVVLSVPDSQNNE